MTIGRMAFVNRVWFSKIFYFSFRNTPVRVKTAGERERGDLISDALPFGGLWYTKTDDAVDYAKFFSRAHPAVIRVYDDAGNVIATHEHTVKVSNLALSGLPVSMCRRPKSGVQPKADNTQTGPVEIR